MSLFARPLEWDHPKPVWIALSILAFFISWPLFLLLDGDRLRFRVAIGLQPGVGRDQIIHAADFHAVTSIIDDSPVRLLGLHAELVQDGEEFIPGEIGH